MNDSPQDISQAPDSEPSSHRHRKRKVKRSSRIKRKAGYIIALVVGCVILMAIWYYLIGLGQHPPAEPAP